MKEYLKETNMLDFSNFEIINVINNKQWRELLEKERIIAIYNYVRDGIAFGYNRDDSIPASEVLKDGYGQCNTKGTLFMAFLRAVGIPCRIHGFTIDKKLQKGAQTGLTYILAPKEIVHSWVEVYYNGTWYNTEGIILDIKYLSALQRKFSDCNEGFCGYGVATNFFRNPTIDWDENNTYIQSEGIVQDFGVYNCPDEFFAEHFQSLSQLKKWMFLHIGRKSMNKNVDKIRNKIKK